MKLFTNDFTDNLLFTVQTAIIVFIFFSILIANIKSDDKYNNRFILKEKENKQIIYNKLFNNYKANGMYDAECLSNLFIGQMTKEEISYYVKNNNFLPETNKKISSTNMISCALVNLHISLSQDEIKKRIKDSIMVGCMGKIETSGDSPNAIAEVKKSCECQVDIFIKNATKEETEYFLINHQFSDDTNTRLNIIVDKQCYN